MKALVLAGGAGTRLRPLTYTGAKQLVPVANRPVLFYCIDRLLAAKVKSIGVIVSPETGSEIEAALVGEAGFKGLGAEFTFIQQSFPGGLAHAVKVARGFLGESDFVMYLGDNLLDADVSLTLAVFESSGCEAHLLLKEVDDPRAFGVATVNQRDHRVLGLEEKPAEPKSNLAVVGVYCFRSSIFDAIERIEPSARGELEIADAVNMLLAGGHEVGYSLVHSLWLDTGKKDDLLAANEAVLDRFLPFDATGKADICESSVLGRVCFQGERIEVVRSKVTGPCVIGPGAKIYNSVIGPFTSVGPKVEVQNSTVSGSVLLEGARVEGVVRMENSLVGKRSRIRSGYSLGDGLEVFIGDDCVVEVPERS